MDFKLVNTHVFTVNGIKYNRVMYANEVKGGYLHIYYISDGRSFLKVKISDITIDGVPLKMVSDLNDILYNSSCSCDYGEALKFRYFDFSFDKTFE